MLPAAMTGLAEAQNCRGRLRRSMRCLRRSHFLRVLEFTRNASLRVNGQTVVITLCIHEKRDVSSYLLREFSKYSKNYACLRSSRVCDTDNGRSQTAPAGIDF